MDLAQLIKDVGFPIAVAAFVLIRMNGTVASLKDAVQGNTAAQHLTTDALRLAVQANTDMTRELLLELVRGRQSTERSVQREIARDEREIARDDANRHAEESR